MVKLEEVEDDHFTQSQPGPKGIDAIAADNDDDFYTDTGKSPLPPPFLPPSSLALS